MLLIFVIDRTIHQRAREVSHPPNSVFVFPADVATQCSNERAIRLIFLTQKPSQRVCLRFSSCCHVSKVHAITWSFAFLAVMMLLLSLIALLQPHFQPFMLSVWTGCKAILSCHLPMADCHNYLTCVILKHCDTVVPCWCWCEPVHMPVMRSAVLCGFHSGDLVPDLHGSVLESEDIEILATHVSHHDLGVCVLKSLKSSRLYGAEQMFEYSVYLNVSVHSNVFLFILIFSYAIILFNTVNPQLSEPHWLNATNILRISEKRISEIQSNTTLYKYTCMCSYIHKFTFVATLVRSSTLGTLLVYGLWGHGVLSTCMYCINLLQVSKPCEALLKHMSCHGVWDRTDIQFYFLWFRLIFLVTDFIVCHHPS